MKNVKIFTILIFVLSMTLASLAGQIGIHLPRQIEVQNGILTIDAISILTGDDTDQAKAAKITLGKLTTPGQIVKIDRKTILSRLASNGIIKDDVKFSGSDAVEVKLKAAKISASKIKSKAEEYLKQAFKNDDRISWELATRPEEVFIEADLSRCEIKCGFDKFGNSKRSRMVNVEIVVDGEVIAKQRLQFLLKYKCTQLTAKTLISRGQEITKENVNVEQIVSDNYTMINTPQPYGMVAKRDIQPGQVIRNGSFRPKNPVKLVKRNQTVIVRLAYPGLVLTVPGQAMQDGYVDDLVKVKVKVTDQEKIIVAKVLENGSLEPVI